MKKVKKWEPEKPSVFKKYIVMKKGREGKWVRHTVEPWHDWIFAKTECSALEERGLEAKIEELKSGGSKAEWERR